MDIDQLQELIDNDQILEWKINEDWLYVKLKKPIEYISLTFKLTSNGVNFYDSCEV